MFAAGDVAADYARIAARGAAFTMPPTGVTGATIATVDDPCGNPSRLTQLTWRG